MSTSLRRIYLALGPILGLLVYLLPLPLNHEQHSLAAVMSLVVVWWLTSPVPLFVTGLIGVCLATLLGVTDFTRSLLGHANPVIFLFMGGFLLARAMSVHDLDRWIAQKSMAAKFVDGHPYRLIVIIMLLCCGFSMFLSNTATTAMFVPVVFSLLTHLEVEEGNKASEIVLMTAYAATIGGIGTPLGSPPNVLATSFLQQNLQINIGFLPWMMRTLPILIFAMAGLFFIFRKELRALPETQMRMVAPPILTTTQKRLLGLLVMTVILWVGPGVLQLFFAVDLPWNKLIASRLSEGLVAALMAGLLFVVPNEKGGHLLELNDIQHIDWGTLLLFGSGISLGQMVFDTGLSRILGEMMPFSSLASPLALGLLAITTLFATELVSNTATANLLIPLILGMPTFVGMPIQAAMIVALSSNMAFMLPVGTPPNAIVFATGKVSLKTMMSKGLQLNLICWVLIWGFGLWLF